MNIKNLLLNHLTDAKPNLALIIIKYPMVTCRFKSISHGKIVHVTYNISGYFGGKNDLGCWYNLSFPYACLFQGTTCIWFCRQAIWPMGLIKCEFFIFSSPELNFLIACLPVSVLLSVDFSHMINDNWRTLDKHLPCSFYSTRLERLWMRLGRTWTECLYI